MVARLLDPPTHVYFWYTKYYFTIIYILLQSAYTWAHDTAKEIWFNQTAAQDVFAIMDSSHVNLKDVSPMEPPVMPGVTLITPPLIQESLTFKEIVNMSSLNHVTAVNSLSWSLTLHTIHVCLVLIR